MFASFAKIDLPLETVSVLQKKSLSSILFHCKFEGDIFKLLFNFILWLLKIKHRHFGTGESDYWLILRPSPIHYQNISKHWHKYWKTSTNIGWCFRKFLTTFIAYQLLLILLGFDQCFREMIRRSNFMRSKFDFFMRSKLQFFMRSKLWSLDRICSWHRKLG